MLRFALCGRIETAWQTLFRNTAVRRRKRMLYAKTRTAIGSLPNNGAVHINRAMHNAGVAASRLRKSAYRIVRLRTELARARQYLRFIGCGRF